MSQLRPEARHAPWLDLDEGQRQAIRRIGALIADAASKLRPHQRTPQKGTLHDWVVQDRSSQIAFLSGPRGSGKTTVLMSLAQPEEVIGSGEGQQQVHEEMELIRDHAVWLEPIDLEPVPEDINLLASILARIELQCDLSGGAPSGENRTAYAVGSGADKAYRSLKNLQRDVAAAWNGNLEKRSEHLDLDSYAVEVMRLEKIRLSLNGRFGETLNDVANGFFRDNRSSKVKDPLFVLPIDDFDLNPTHALKLLRYLRSVWTPRLFTVLIGDFNVLSLVSTLDMSNRLFSLATEVYLPDLLPISSTEISTAAAEISVSGLRKLIPPSQRIQLPRRSIEEGLYFKPLGAAKSESLHELLEKIRCGCELPFVSDRHPTEGTSLRSMLLSTVEQVGGTLKVTPIVPDPTPQMLLRQAPVYAAADVLKMGPRRVTDLWLALSDHVSERKTAPAREGGTSAPHTSEEIQGRLMSQLLSLLLEDRALSPLERQSTEKVLSSPAVEFYPRKLPLNIAEGAETARTEIELAARPVGNSSHWEDDGVTGRLCISLRTLSRIEPRRDEGESFSAALELLSDSSRMIMLVNDVLQDTEARRHPSRSLISGEAIRGWALVRWSRGGRGEAEVSWPTWPVRTFWACDVIRAMLEKVLQAAETAGGADVPPEDKLKLLAGAWVAIGHAMFDGAGVPLPEHQLKPSADLIRGLRQRGNKLAQQPSLSADASEWLASLAHFVTPELGLPRDFVALLLHDGPKPADSGPSPLVKLWNKRIQLLRQQRLARLARIWVEDEELAESFADERELPTLLRGLCVSVERIADEGMKLRPVNEQNPARSRNMAVGRRRHGKSAAETPGSGAGSYRTSQNENKR